jgi:colanic acid biosynthesis protein WcaH
MYLSRKDFTVAVSNLPLVSIDLCIISPQKKMLFVKRNCPPARDFYFTPGGRIRKNETIEDAMNRIAREEVGLGSLYDLKPSLMGAWDHFYPDSAFDPKVSTHYVNLPHVVHLSDVYMESLEIAVGDECQHRSYLWLDVVDASQRMDVHNYSRLYAQYISRVI